MLAGGEIELGAHGASIFDADPVENALVGCAFAFGGEVEDVAVLVADFFVANVGGGVVDGVVGAGDVAIGGVAGEPFEGCDAHGAAGIGKIDPHVVAEHEQVAAFVAGAHEFDVGLVGAFLRDFVERLFVGLAGFEVGDLDAQNVSGPAVAVGVGALEQGFGVGSCGVADCSPGDEECDGDDEQERSDQLVADLGGRRKCRRG